MARSTTATVTVPGAESACTHLDTTAKFFRALSDPTRLKLLEFILAGERTPPTASNTPASRSPGCRYTCPAWPTAGMSSRAATGRNCGTPWVIRG